MTRPLWSRRAVALSMGAVSLAGCAPRAAGISPRPGFAPAQPLVPLRLSEARLTHVTVCTRPFRAAGPRLDVETVGDKRVVHNYGHGGSGWSLCWGSSEIAAARALEGGAAQVAVIGCGALGLTSALLLQRAGATVTIYAADRPEHSRSARASGTWSPDSRIAASDRTGAGFPALWEKMARASYAAFQPYVGLPGAPVAWTDRYTVLDGAPARSVAPSGAPEIRFARLERQIGDLAPSFRDVPPESHPFAGRRVRHGVSMQFNIALLLRMLTGDFLREGGRLVPMILHSPADLARLPEPVVVNCTGYGARALWGDEGLMPVRGQIAWLAPQEDARYGIHYRQVSVLSRPDGMMVQYLGANEMWGMGDTGETPDGGEARDAIRAAASLFGGNEAGA